LNTLIFYYFKKCFFNTISVIDKVF
jgi:hypothetical protein